MRIKAIYRKNLKMSEGKLAAQIAHAVKNLGETPVDCDIVVLKVSDKKFDELTSENKCYVQVDKGLTEVESGTRTAAAWIEDEFILVSEEYPQKGKPIIGIDDEGLKHYCFKCACKNPNCKEWRCSITGGGLMVNIIKWKYE